MENRNWTIEEANETIINLYKANPNASYRAIAIILNKKFKTNWWDGDRVRDRKRKIEKKQQSMLEEIIPEINEKIESNGKKRILVIADAHFPFHRDDISYIFEKNIKDVDAVVFAGDMFDNQALSKFEEIAKKPFEEDLIDFYWFIKKLLDMNVNNVPVYVIRGNHEERLAKYIAANQQKQINKFINPQIMQMFVDGFCIYEGYSQIKFEPIKNIVYINNWYLNINDSILICHQKDFNKPKLKTVCNGIDYFSDLNEKFDAIFLAHMHTSGQTVYHNKYGYNIPCMCKPQSYANSGKFQYSPQSYGYTIISTDKKGKFDVNNTNIVHLEEMYENVDENVQYKINI